MDVRLHLAHEFRSVAADVVEVHLGSHELALGIDDEGAAQGQTGARIIHAEKAAHLAGGVGGERVLHVLHQALGVAPDHVREFRVGRDGDHMRAKFGQPDLLVGKVRQLGGADKGEVRRVKHEDGPLAFLLDVGERHLAEVAVRRLVGFHFEIRHDGADGRDDISKFHGVVMFGGVEGRFEKRLSRVF